MPKQCPVTLEPLLENLIEFAADPDRMARFKREAKVLASLHHPNIASIFGFESEGDSPFLVMELVEGEDLSELLKRGPVPTEDAVDIARRLAPGEAFAFATAQASRYTAKIVWSWRIGKAFWSRMSPVSIPSSMT